MTDKVYAVQTRSSDKSSDWTLTGETASIRAVRLYNEQHGWEKARLMTPEAAAEAQRVRDNMAALADVSHG